MTRKDKFYRRGLWFLMVLFFLQNAAFLVVYVGVRKERKIIHENASLLSASLLRYPVLDSRQGEIQPDGKQNAGLSGKNLSPQFPYSETIGVGRTKSSKGRVMFYKDIRTYTTNGVFTTRREYLPTPFFITNAPARAGVRAGR